MTAVSASVRLTTSDGTATNTLDYRGTNALVHFRPGETNRVVAVPIFDDTLFEGDETVVLTLSDPSAKTYISTNNPGTLLIVDDESILEFARLQFEVKEYETYALVEVLRRGGTINPVSVDYRTIPGTASNEVDYVSQAGILEFAGDSYVLRPDGSGILDFQSGESSKILRIGILDDVLGEGDETFQVRLSNAVGPTAGALPGSTALGTVTNTTVTILDNEAPGNVDYEFNPGEGANDRVLSVAVQPNLRIVFGGDFTSVSGVSMPRVARLRQDGTLDTSFNPGVGANNTVQVVASQADGKVLIGGAFTAFDNTNRSGIARLNADGRLDLSFDPGSGANGLVRALAAQADGKILAGGDFSQMGGVSAGRLVRLNENGSVDKGFAVVADDTVYSIAVQPDGQIVIGGAFRTVNGLLRNGVARLSPGGVVDRDFNPGEGPNRPVYSAAPQPNGQIVLGGLFTSVSAARLSYLARLNTDGSVDVDFDSGTGPSGPVYSVAVHPGGKIIIGGAFTNFNGIDRNYFARLRSDGSLDSMFRIGRGANALVRSVAVQPNSAVILGGEFTQIDGLPRQRIARIHGDEYSNVVGLEFSRSTYTVSEEVGKAEIVVLRSGNTNGSVQIRYGTADGTAVAGVDYEATEGTLSFGPGELRKSFFISIADDSEIEVDETVQLFLTNAPPNVELLGSGTALLVIKDNEKSIWFSADTYKVAEAGTNAVITILRLGPLTGTVSALFSTSNGTATAGVDYVAVSNRVEFAEGQDKQTVLVPILDDAVKEENKTVLLHLSEPGGDVQLGLAAATLTIEDDEPGIGGLVVTFNPGAGADNFVRSVAVQNDGKIVLGGAFTQFDGTNRSHVARLNTNGAHDLSFNPGAGANALVASVAALSSGKVLLGGTFTNVNGTGCNRVARLNNDGGLDLTFNRSLSYDGAVNGLTVQPNGGLVLGGAFGRPTRAISQLRANGTLDPSFNPGSGANGPVHTVIIQTNGQVLMGGAFTEVGGVPRNRLARLNPDGLVDSSFAPMNVTNGTVYSIVVQNDGKLLIGGDLGVANLTNRPNILRLNPADGTLDPSFDPGAGANAPVFAIALQSNERIVIGGDFTMVQGTNRNHYARLLPNGAIDHDFDPKDGANGTVYCLAVLPSRNIVIGGAFTRVNGVARNGVALIRADDLELTILAFDVEGGVARMTVSTVQGRSYTLEASQDLKTWQVLDTGVATASTMEFTDSSAGFWTRRFYRVRQND